MYRQTVKPNGTLIIGEGKTRIVIQNCDKYRMKVGIDADKSVPIRTGENPGQRRVTCETVPMNRLKPHDEPLRAA